MSWDIVALFVIIFGATFTVVKWIRGSQAKSDALDLRNAELEAERRRVRQMETAAAEARRQRITEMDAQAARVRTSADADALLRRATGADDPETN